MGNKRPKSVGRSNELVFSQFELELRREDFARAEVSEACQLSIPRVTIEGPAKYLILKLPLHIKRVIAQLRLANQYNAYISLSKCAARLSPHALCENCNLREDETVVHFFFKCPLYTPHRNFYLTPVMQGNKNRAALEKLLATEDS